MSPEQLEGRAVDARTDIYALGLIVYEMVTGQRAFNSAARRARFQRSSRRIRCRWSIGSRKRRTISSSSSMSALPDPDDRWQSAQDLARALTWIRESGRRAAGAWACAGGNGTRRLACRSSHRLRDRWPAC